nr:terminase large subunit [uncultured Rhodopila sp.]
MAWSLACPDWETRLKEGRSLVPDLPLDKKRAATAVAVFNKLRLPDVPGQPALAEAAGDWFRDIVRALFGSLDQATGERMVRELFCLVPKKNSKTSYGALMMLTALLLNLRPRAKFILTGPTQDIAELAFSQTKGAIELDDTLSKKLHVRDHLKKIEHRQTGAELEIMTFDPNVLTGQKPAGVLIDEIHVSARMAKATSAIRQLRGGMLAMPESFLVFITTQSEEPPVGVFKAELNKARAIRDGTLQAAMLPVLYEFPDAMQRDRAAWSNPANWPMVIPNNGRSIRIERLIEEFRVAESVGDDELRAWTSQHLNIEIGVALRSDGWTGARFWERGADPDMTLDDIIERSEVIVVGIDGGGADDLLGIGVIGRETGTRRWLHWAHALVTEAGAEQRKANASRYADFEKTGDLTMVAAPPEDLVHVVSIVERIQASGLLAGVGVDPAGTGTVVDALADIGITAEGKLLVGITQGIRLMGPIKTIERKLMDGTFVHCDQPLMAWCVGNAKVEATATAIRIERAASGYGKIDPLMATFNAAALMETNPASAMITQGFVAL